MPTPKKKRDEPHAEPQVPGLPPGVKLFRVLEGHENVVYSVAFDPEGKLLASGGNDRVVKLWEVDSGKLLRTLEGYTGDVDAVAFSGDGRLLVGKSKNGTLRLSNCETWHTVAIIPELTNPKILTRGLAFHPASRLLSSVGSKPDAPPEEKSKLIHLWALD